MKQGLDREDKDGKTTKETHQSPASGVFPEKVNKGRVQVNGSPFSMGPHPLPAAPSRGQYSMQKWRTDSFATLFVKARINAFNAPENLLQTPRLDENFRNRFNDEAIGSVTNGGASSTQEAHRYPANGVFPERVRYGRMQGNGRPYSIGQNLELTALSWSE